MQGPMLANRILWIGIALGVLVCTYFRFRFADPAAGTPARRASESALRGSRSTPSASAAGTGAISASVAGVRHVASDVDRRTFGFATHLRQVFAIASTSFGAIARSASGLALWIAVAVLIVLFMPLLMELTGISLVPRTADVIALLTAAVAGNQRFPWVLMPLLILFYAGELVWRERDARLSEIADTTPVPEWVFFVGKFLGLSLVLVIWMALLAAAGALGQVAPGLFQCRARAVPADPVRDSTRRVPPLRRARLRGARAGESEARRLPRGAHRLWIHRLCLEARD